MKLIYCPHCHDIVKLHQQVTTCRCGKSYGTYLDDLNAIYSGDAVPLGIDNLIFATVLKNQPEKGQGEYFYAFVVPKKCPTFIQVKHIEPPGNSQCHPTPDEEVTFGGVVRKTGIKRGPYQGIQPRK